MTEKELRASLLDTYVIKTKVRQKVYNNTLQSFRLLKKILKMLEKEYISMITEQIAPASLPLFRDRGPFEVSFEIGEDLLIFSMHSNIFEFDNKHPVLNSSYIKDDPLRSYCGMINIYNFLSDSFKYNRTNDFGYLVARLFINKDNHYFVVGKRQSEDHAKSFAVDTISPGIIRQITETAIRYCIEFDLLIPPYDKVKIATVEQMQEKIIHSRMTTGKRLGFGFNSDDI